MGLSEKGWPISLILKILVDHHVPHKMAMTKGTKGERPRLFEVDHHRISWLQPRRRIDTGRSVKLALKAKLGSCFSLLGHQEMAKMVFCAVKIPFMACHLYVDSDMFMVRHILGIRLRRS